MIVQQASPSPTMAFGPSSPAAAYHSPLFGQATTKKRSRHVGRPPFVGPASSVLSYAMKHHHHQPLSPLLSAASITLPAATSTSSAGFFKLLFVFCLGGIFFSTALAAVSACYAVGLENVKFLWEVFLAVVKTVWLSFTAALATAKSTLLFREESSEKKKEPWKWRQAWKVLKEELAKTRRTAAEGVQALQEQTALYAGVVGTPGLIPIQYIVDRFLPFSIAGALEDAFKDSLSDVSKKTRSITKIKLTGFTVGTRTPTLETARIYELGEEGVAFDCGIKWPSELEAKLTVYSAGGLARIPVVVKNICFDGIIRLVMTPLCKEPPGFGAVLVSFPKSPRINLDIRVAGGDITRIPWLRSELITAIQKGIAEELLWPKRVVVPSFVPTPTGKRALLSSAELAKLETMDPLLRREQVLAARPVLKQQMEKSQPVLSSLKQQFKVFVNRREKDPDTDQEPSKEPSKETISSQASDEEHVDHKRTAAIETGVLWQKLLRKGDE